MSCWSSTPAVPGGGRDPTRELVEGFAGRLDVRYLYLEPESLEFRLAAARDLGLRHATGKTLIISGGDCMPHADMVRLVVEHARNDRVVIGIRERIPLPTAETLARDDLRRLPDLVYQEDERLAALPEESTALFLSLKDTVGPAPAAGRSRRAVPVAWLRDPCRGRKTGSSGSKSH